MNGDWLSDIVQTKGARISSTTPATVDVYATKRIRPIQIDDNDQSLSPACEEYPGLKNLQFSGNTRENCKSKSQKVSPADNAPLKKSRFQGTRFLITLNEPDHWTNVLDYLTNKGPTFLIASLEEAPRTGHKHIHCYCQFPKQVQLYSGKIHNAHVDICRGSPEQNISYVEKEGNLLIELGDRPKPKKGKLTIGEASKLTWEELQSLPVTQLRHILLAKNEAELRKWQESGAVFNKVEVEWIYGPTGTGKTRYVVENHATTVTYNNGFFSNWGDSRTIAFEEFRGEIPYRLFLQITDSYHGHYTVNIKGGQKVIDIDKVIITSPLSPQQVYKQQAQKEDSINQLLRRITKLVRLGEEQPSTSNTNVDLNNVGSRITLTEEEDDDEGWTLRRRSN